jgi:hypothetical protein
MKIQQAWSNYVEGHGQFEDFFKIFGLSVDGKVYEWDDTDGHWEMFVKNKPEPKNTSSNDDDPINLDEIPF